MSESYEGQIRRNPSTGAMRILRNGTWEEYTDNAPQPTQQQPQRIQTRGPRPTPTPSPPSGYRWGPNGTLVPIQGGPADPALRGGSGNSPAAVRLDMQNRNRGTALDALSTQLDRVNNLYQENYANSDDILSLGQYFPSPTNDQFNAASAGLGEQALSAFRVPGVGSQSDTELRAFITANQPSSSDYDSTIEEKLRTIRTRIDAARAAQGLAPWNWAGGQVPPEVTNARQDTSTPLALQQNRRAGADETVVFGDQQAPVVGPRFTPEQEAALDQAMRAPDANPEQIAQMAASFGIAVDPASIRSRIEGLRNPNARVGPLIDYSRTDQGAIQQNEQELYGSFLDSELERQRTNPIGGLQSGVLGAADTLSLGSVDEIAAPFRALFQGQSMDEAQQQIAARVEANRRLNPGSYMTGQIGGAVLNPLNRVAPNAGILGQGGIGAVEGGVYGFNSGQGLDDRLRGGVGGALSGGLGGGIGGGVAGGVSRVANPQVAPNVRTLIDEGVEPTIGQIVGQGGIVGQTARRLEDVLGSVGIIGAPVRNAQQRANGTLNRAQIQRALRPIGEELPRDVPIGHQGIDYAYQRLSETYNRATSNISGTADNGFQRRVGAIISRTFGRTPAIPPDHPAQAALNAVAGELRNAFDGTGAYNGRRLRDVSERLGDVGRSYSTNDDPYLRYVGDTALRLRQQLHALAQRQNPGGPAQLLRAADRGYASLVRTQRAALRDPGGVFTPGDLNSAVRNTDRSTRRNQVSRGRALDQDLAGAAFEVMGNTASQGGSKDVNSLIALGLGAGSAFSGNPAAITGALGFGVGAPLAYTQTGQDALRWLLARQAGPVGQGIAQGANTLGRSAPIDAAVLNEYYQQGNR